MTFAIWKPKYDIRQGDDATVRAEAERPTVAYLPNGGYVVAWSEGDNQLKFKVYNGAGETNGTVYSVDQSTNLGMNIDIQPVGTDGSFAVGWNAGLSTNATLKVRVFTHNNDGTYTGGTVEEVQRNTTGSAELPSLSSRAGGGFTSTYTNGSNVFLRLHEADGSTSRTIELFGTPSSSIDYPRVTEITPNKFVVAYGRGDNIEFKIVTVSGATVTVGNAVDALAGDKSKVVALKDTDGNANGQFAIVQYRDNNLVAKFYDQNGNRTGDGNNEVVIATNVWPYENYFDVTAIRGGRIAVTYSDFSPNIALKVLDIDGNSGNVNTDGTPNNNPLIVSPVGHRQPTITEMADGRLAVAYEDWTNGTFIDTTGVIVDPRLTKVTVNGTERNDYYIGSEYSDDILRGNGGADTLYGGDGNDNLIGGAGADRFVGGDYFGKDNGTADNVSYWGAKNAQGQLEAVEIYLWDVRKNKGFEAEGDTYVGIEVISGTVLNDVIEGDNANNTFWGDNGDDVLKGFGGNDTLKGANGADTLYGGLGNDHLDGGLDSAAIRNVVTYKFSTAGIGVRASLEDSTQNTGEAAGDTYSEIDDLVGTAWDDVLIGSRNGDLSSNWYNKLSGGDGNDTLEGLRGEDTLDGGTGYNFASYENAEEAVRTSLGVDEVASRAGDAVGDVYVEDTIQGLIGSKFDDTLAGSDAFANEIRGGAGADELHGGGGSDTLMGGAGADKLFGGADFDYASYLDSTVGVAITLPGGGNGTVAGDTFESIEGLIGSEFGDTLTGNAAANTLRGMGGNDLLSGGAGSDALDGGVGIDTVSYAGAGGAVSVNLASGAGNGSDAQGDSYSSIENAVGSNFGDVFVGNGAANSFMGLGGNDTYFVSAGDSIAESAGGGTDKVVADFSYTLGAEIEDLEGAGGALVLTGNALNNTITGNAAGNWIDGGIGADTMAGGAGDDTYVIDDAGDRIVDGQGSDTVILKVNYDLSLLSPSVKNITMMEGLALNLTGTSGANVLMGNVAANTLSGLGGNDTIYGKGGNDKLYGGAGKDVFVFDTALHKTRNVDRIYDFKSSDDSFHLDNQYFTKLGKGTPTKPVKFKADMFVEGTRAQDREDRIVYDRKSGNLYYDKDGTGGSAQVKIATINNKTKLAYHDFFVI